MPSPFPGGEISPCKTSPNYAEAKFPKVLKIGHNNEQSPRQHNSLPSAPPAVGHRSRKEGCCQVRRRRAIGWNMAGWPAMRSSRPEPRKAVRAETSSCSRRRPPGTFCEILPKEGNRDSCSGLVRRTRAASSPKRGTEAKKLVVTM